ncbi:hypothetical protein MC885_017005 [Smutsia gigantea]|nr:hypothetical protein MC885_017005 [Smutsia gigantea]
MFSAPSTALGYLSPALLYVIELRGLLICLPREQAARFCAEIKSPKYGEGHQAWIIGIVEKGNRTARIIDKPRIIEVAPQVGTQNVNPTPGATS